MIEEEWSKREKLDFYRALITFGVPLLKDNDYDWAFLKDKANLRRKSPDLIEKYYIEFLKACRGIIQGGDAEKKKAAAAPPAPAAAGGMLWLCVALCAFLCCVVLCCALSGALSPCVLMRLCALSAHVCQLPQRRRRRRSPRRRLT